MFSTQRERLGDAAEFYWSYEKALEMLLNWHSCIRYYFQIGRGGSPKVFFLDARLMLKFFFVFIFQRQECAQINYQNYWTARELCIVFDSNVSGVDLLFIVHKFEIEP